MKTRLQILLLLTIFLPFILLQAQITIGSSIPANRGSLLDMKEYAPDADNTTSTGGLVLPRVLLNTKGDFEPILSGASGADKLKHVGLTVYHKGNANLCSVPYVWDGDQWSRLPDACQIKMNCGSVTINGTYKVGQALVASNTITVAITVPFGTVGGTYNIYTDTQNGMTFSATGNLQTGIQTITLAGTGAPMSGGSATIFSIQAEYSNSESSQPSCSVKIPAEAIPIGKSFIFGFGSTPGDYGYYLNSSAARELLNSPNNFGSGGTAKVNSDGFTIVTADYAALTVPNFVSSPTTGLSLNPDIIVNGFETYTVSSAVIDELINYLENGGVLILFDEYGDNSVSANPWCINL